MAASDRSERFGGRCGPAGTGAGRPGKVLTGLEVAAALEVVAAPSSPFDNPRAATSCDHSSSHDETGGSV